MQEESRPSLKNIDVIFLTFFGVGFSPWFPGTIGALATLPLLYLLSITEVSILIVLSVTFVVSIISSLLAERAQKKYKVHDPSWIVIDEVLGMTVAWTFLQDIHIIHLLISFVLFRFFDIVKIWPASYFDKKVKHGCGVILDDLVSGIYAGLVYLLIFSFILS